MKRVLLCEDEGAIREFIVINLKRANLDVVDVECGEDALLEYASADPPFDVVILDIMLPSIDGFEICKALRDKNDDVGIIFLSAKTQEYDKIKGFSLGADDYLTKPFSPSELVARVEAILRRINRSNTSKKKAESIIITDGFVLDIDGKMLSKDTSEFVLTQVEFSIVELLMKNANVTLSREEILRKVWGEDKSAEPKAVDVNIRRLRMKIEENPSEPKYIITVRGNGYRWQTKE